MIGGAAAGYPGLRQPLGLRPRGTSGVEVRPLALADFLCYLGIDAAPPMRT
ncbi:hypothetical protein ES703_71691 [subsurface metagenome]